MFVWTGEWPIMLQTKFLGHKGQLENICLDSDLKVHKKSFEGSTRDQIYGLIPWALLLKRTKVFHQSLSFRPRRHGLYFQNNLVDFFPGS